MVNTLNKLVNYLNLTQRGDFIAPLLLRIYLVPIFWMAGTSKLSHFDSTVSWFETSLGLPFPTLMASLAIGAELGGAILLALGLAVRWVSVPLMFTMIVAAVSVHWKNGWLAIATGDGVFSTERTIGAIDRLDRVKGILNTHANYDWLTENGSVVILNNGIEFAATYFIMLVALFFVGGGRYLSVDYWVAKRFKVT
ncbi:hypothetical protein A9Q99_22945 [Gammaproteobacteria bacterium 45_16_T64]|nr:hypothetical protein A9Q99_22945 [Gammaproteobacteria bacterium 45_16_T64]